MNKIVIVTGASRGIGKEIAKELAIKGYTVVANYNKSENQIKELQKELSEKNVNIDIFKADISKRSEAKELVKYVLEKYNKIDILINNAGISQIKEFTQITDEDWNNMINVNLNSVFYMTQEVIPNMIHNKKGCIINMSSIWGQIGASCESHYSVSKAGIDAMTKSLAKELGPSNIRVNSIAPGLINTDMNKDLTKEDLEEIKKEIPLGRIAEPEEIVKSIRWLIDDEYISGQIISVNGGWNI